MLKIWQVREGPKVKVLYSFSLSLSLDMTAKHSVLFVCLGNICRSTMAEGIFQHLVKERGLQDEWLIDSAGTGNWHVGYAPDSRTISVLNNHGIVDYEHTARLIKKEDFTTFEYIFGMDHENITDIKEFAPTKSTAKIALLGEFDPEKKLVIEDPYFAITSNKSAFQDVYDQCLRSCAAFLDSLATE